MITFCFLVRMLSVFQFCFLVNIISVLSSFGCKLCYHLLRDSEYQIFRFNMKKQDEIHLTVNNSVLDVIGRLDATLFGSEKPCEAVLKEWHRILGLSKETGDKVCMITVCHELNLVFNSPFIFKITMTRICPGLDQT